MQVLLELSQSVGLSSFNAVLINSRIVLLVLGVWVKIVLNLMFVTFLVNSIHIM